MRTQPREGQCSELDPKYASPDTTHVAQHTNARVQYFCRLDTSHKGHHQGVRDEDVPGDYWITPCVQYGSCYNGSSLWQGGFTFTPLAEIHRIEEERLAREVAKTLGSGI